MRLVLCILINVAFFCMSSGFIFSQGAWVRKADFPGGERVEAASFSIGTKGIVAGGMKRLAPPYNFCKDAYAYSPANDLWTSLPDLPYEITEGISFTMQNKSYILSGRDSLKYNYHIIVWDSLTQTWSIEGAIPEVCKRIRGLGFSIGNKGYIAFGIDTTNAELLNDIWEFDPVTNLFTQKTSCPGLPRYDASHFIINQKAYILTGYTYSDFLNDLWEYNPLTDIWTQKAALPSESRAGATAFSIGDYGYLTWGWGNDFIWFRELWKYDPMNDSWLELEPFPDAPRTYGRNFVIDETAYLTTGNFFYNWESTWAFTPDPVVIREQIKPGLLIFPNPTSDFIRILLPSQIENTLSTNKSMQNTNPQLFHPACITFYDLRGTRVQSHTLSRGQTHLETNVSSWVPGMYVVVCTIDGEAVVSGKVVVSEQ